MTRYREFLKAHFGVTIPDLTVQVPQYLGGKRIPLNITQVLQTSASGDTPIGYTGAFSNTSFTDRPFIKSFNEYGILMGIACIRTEQSYSQGISKAFFRDRRFDYYHPALANLSEMPVYKKELYIEGFEKSGGAEFGDEVFGYQEAWAEYRYHPNMVTGALSPMGGDENFIPWTYTNNFTAKPVLNGTFVMQPYQQIGDTLFDSTTFDQFLVDMYFDLKCTRPMPLYSIPGLIDHH